MISTSRPIPSNLTKDLLGLALLGVPTLVVMGLLFWIQPWAAIAAGLAFTLGIVLMAWPNVATLTVLFLIYINAPVVAVQFHGVPYAVGAAVPLALAAPLAYFFFVRKQMFYFGRVSFWILIFLLIRTLSYLFCSEPGFALLDLASSAVEGLCLYVLIINVVRTPEMLRKVTWALLLAGSILGALTGFQYVTKTYSSNYGGFAQQGVVANYTSGSSSHSSKSGGRRLAGSIGEANRYAQVMLMLVPLGYFRFRSERSRILRVLALGATMLTLGGMMLTFSRGAAVGFVMVVGIMVVLRYVSIYQCALMMLVGCALVLASPKYSERILSLLDLGKTLNKEGKGIEEADNSIQGRFTENLAAALMYAEHPVLGVGPGLFSEYYVEYAARVGGRVRTVERQAHNLYLHIGAESGTLGLGVYLLIVFLVMRDLVRGRRRCLQCQPDVANMATGYMLAISSYLTTGLFLHFSFIRYFWLMLALGAVAARIAAAAPCQQDLEPQEVGTR